MRRLKKNKHCSCGAFYDRVPSSARAGEEGKDEFPGFFWECDACKSTLYVTPNAVDDSDYCECSDCEDSDFPCWMDCDPGEECEGCREARMVDEDIRFDIGSAQGRR